MLHRPVTRGEPDQAGHAYVVGVVVLDELLAAEGVDDRRLQRRRQGDELVVRAGAAGSGEDGHMVSGVQYLRRGGQ